MIARLTLLVHEKVLPFFEVNTSHGEIDRGGSNLLEAVVQTDYLTKTVMSVAGCLAICFAEPMFERVHRQFETVFEFEFAVDR